MDPPKSPRAKYRRGTHDLRALMGEVRAQVLRSAVTVYAPSIEVPRRPKEPDLIAFRQDADGAARVCAVEAKVNDQVRPDQLLGLALIHLVLKADVNIWRYSPSGSRRQPQVHRAVFRPLARG